MSDKEELETLKKTFEDFISTSMQLERSYETLKEESQQLSLYLSNILENLNAAVMVFDNQFRLNLWNGQTRRYFPQLEERVPPVPLESISGPTITQGNTIDIDRILKGKTQDEFVEVPVTLDGVSRWLEIHCSDFMDNKREKTGYLVVIYDKSEFKKLQIKSQQEDRLRVMGELAAEVAHEIRNPLGSIELMVTLLQEDLQNNPTQSDLLARIRTSVDNMNHTVTNILLYTREIHPNRTEFPIDELISHAENIALNIILKKQIKIEKQLHDININGDFELLKQCLANILINAAQAVENNGLIEISAELHKEFIQIYIKDNGCGIPEEHKEKVFKPFFTTKNTGTGLGLAMVKRVIEAHTGKIYFTSDTTGTTFVVELPHPDRFQS